MGTKGQVDIICTHGPKPRVIMRALPNSAVWDRTCPKPHFGPDWDLSKPRPPAA